MSAKEFWGALSIVLTIAAYAPYFRSIFRRETKPHMFTWIIGGTVNGIAAGAQISRHAGIGGWVTGFTALACFVIVLLAVRWGEKTITRGDWVSFLAALAAMPIWYATGNPLSAALLASAIDALAVYPTLRKSWSKPREENALSWFLSCLRSALSIAALESYSATTVIFPVVATLLNGAVFFTLVWRRAVLARGAK